MIKVKEKMFRSADNRLKNTVRNRYFLYGGTKRLSTFRNCLISIQSKAGRTNHSLVYKDSHPIGSGLHIFLYIPDTADSQFLSIIFDVFLKEMIRDMIPPRVAITEGSDGTARQLKRVLQRNGLLNETGEGRVILETSGTEKDLRLMRKLLGESEKQGET